ncbi:MAG: hypothetical protein ACREBE_21225, partial [bacterium]
MRPLAAGFQPTTTGPSEMRRASKMLCLALLTACRAVPPDDFTDIATAAGSFVMVSRNGQVMPQRTV